MITKKIQDNLDNLKSRLPIDESFDIVVRELKICGKDSFLLFLDGLTKDNSLLYVLNRLQRLETCKSIDDIVKESIAYIEVETDFVLDNIIKSLLSGMSVIIIDGYTDAILLDTREYQVRSPEEPELEKATRGSRDGLVETIVFNTSMIRRRLRDEKLVFEMHSIGSRSQTDICISYLSDIVDNNLLNKIRKKINKAKIDALVMNIKTLEELIVNKQKFNPFPVFRYTERADVVSAHLLEGHICIIVDNSPSVMIVPVTFFYFTQHVEDYTHRPIIGNYIRLVRYGYLFSSLILIPLWILGVEYVDYLPEGLKFLGPKDETPIPIFAQFLILDIGFTGIRLASIHTPSTLSTSLGIIGGLLIGQFAVDVGWLVPETILYMSAVLIGQFATPSIEFSYAIRFMRLVLLILTGLFLIYGFVFGIVLTLIILLSTKTINGYNYLYPLIPFNLKNLLNMIFRTPIQNKKRTK